MDTENIKLFLQTLLSKIEELKTTNSENISALNAVIMDTKYQINNFDKYVLIKDDYNKNPKKHFLYALVIPGFISLFSFILFSGLTINHLNPLGAEAVMKAIIGLLSLHTALPLIYSTVSYTDYVKYVKGLDTRPETLNNYQEKLKELTMRSKNYQNKKVKLDEFEGIVQNYLETINNNEALEYNECLNIINNMSSEMGLKLSFKPITSEFNNKC